MDTHMHCPYCEEAIEPIDVIENMPSGEQWHSECLLRSVLGSVAHQRRHCSCFIPGSTENDPPGMAKRQAALAAVEEARSRKDRACPACGSKEFHPGPARGSARNVKCAQCGAKYWYRPPLAPERIDNDDRFYDLTLVQKL